MPTILVIEDDSAIRRGVADALTFGGYEVIEGADGKTGERLALQARFDLLLLDLVLPGASGFDILQALKRDRPGIPIIILSARGEEADRVNGLKFGADDYVVKPFSMKELLARVEAVLRGSPERPPAVSAVAFPGGGLQTSNAARRCSTMAIGWSCRIVRRRSSPTSRDTKGEPFHERKFSDASGKSILPTSRPALSTCTSRTCGPSYETPERHRRFS